MKIFVFLWSISFAYGACVRNGSRTHPSYENSTDGYLNAEQAIRKYGYEAESHTVKTADGYLLTMHRVANKDPKNQKLPIFVQHGFLGTSMDFFLLDKSSLAFVLADLGYDVWLGNVRGNTISRAHVSLFPEHKNFWNFTWHESAIYDLPAEIDYILNYTKHEKLTYLGYSMGTTMFLVLTSTLPEYNQKIDNAFLMAVIGYLKNARSPMINFLAKFSSFIETLYNLFGTGEFMPNNQAFKDWEKTVCLINGGTVKICMEPLYWISGCDPEDFSPYELELLLDHNPNGYSFKAIEHYTQLLKSGKFRQFDYGKKGNLIQYGTDTPPDYNVSSITTPLYFYEGKNDYLSSLKDVKHLAQNLSSLKNIYIVSYPYFNHLDFLSVHDAKRLVYDRLVKDLESASNKLK